jgi:hypothetical protein
MRVFLCSAFSSLTFAVVLSAQVVSTAATSASGQTRRALLIGINQYAPPAGASLPSPTGHRQDSRFAPGTSWTNLKGPSTDVSAIKVLLEQKYAFTDLRVLPEAKATREGILAALNQLIADTRPGDFVVFYFAGHGSVRTDTLSSKNHLDETIVPRDAWSGAEDLRDKELAALFNQIVFDKHAHLTAIFDSCHSGTMARGITASVQRVLPYDDRDVADEKKDDPTIIVEADLKTVPAQGDAILLAAASSSESAAEALYGDSGVPEWHGAFTRALVRVLSAGTQTQSASDVVAEVAAMLHADPVPFQQPSVEGRADQSLFGTPVAAHPLRVHVTKVQGAAITLDLGSAGGFDKGTRFRAADATPAQAPGSSVTIEVHEITGPLTAQAHVVAGSAPIKVGQAYDLTSMVYPLSARLRLFMPLAEPAPLAAIASAHQAFPAFNWVADPALVPIQYLVIRSDSGWRAFDQSGHLIAPATNLKGLAFLLLGPPPELRDALEQTVPFKSGAFAFTQALAESPNYFFATRVSSSGTPQYALFDPVILAPHKSDAYIQSVEKDPEDVQLNGGIPPAVVCRNDVSLPVRTGWLGALGSSPAPGNLDDLVLAINRRIVRLGKLRTWLQSPALAPGDSGWPYQLAITQPGSATLLTGLLHAQQQYDVKMITTAERRAANPPDPKYIYLFGFDCAANPFLLYPDDTHRGDAPRPQPGQDNVFPLVSPILSERVGTPLGADTIFLLATAEVLSAPGILVQDGVLGRATRGSGSPFDELVGDMSDESARGPETVPSHWLVQQIVLPSRP